MTAGRGSWTDAQFEQLVADYLSGDPLRVLAARYNRSSTWVRETLDRLGVPRRPKGGVQEPVPTAEIVRLRDEECLSWSEISARTGLTEEALRSRYRSANADAPARRYNRRGADTDDAVWRRNEATNHLEGDPRGVCRRPDDQRTFGRVGCPGKNHYCLGSGRAAGGKRPAARLQQRMTERGVGDIVVSVDDHHPSQVASIMGGEVP
ncbi:hypothetical protein [Microlunatus sp. Gsoil 973]|uniref:hypothetical protein n=1 Tax=Microlunatus sp. Gsoil 973 TaxID=2672569 RepID=UPI0012B5043F|nr:hypothetical protein [Microlunatus sp. Gsoil 973]QGN34498.1 hypothetical protein GJV80_18625 [Microlunatus sp. Gsoil 973]